MTQAELDELRQIWRKRVDAFLASGQSGAKWCTAHEIKDHTNCGIGYAGSGIPQRPHR